MRSAIKLYFGFCASSVPPLVITKEQIDTVVDVLSRPELIKKEIFDIAEYVPGKSIEK